MIALALALALAGVDVEVPADVAAEEASTSTVPALPLPQFGVADDGGALARERLLLKGLQAQRLAAGHTVIGGYAQINATALSVGAGDDGGPVNDVELSATLRRLVLFVAHTFTDDIRFYTEFEWEHAIACRSCVGAVEIEQAFLEVDVVEGKDAPAAVTARGGLVLIPFGILNQWHEPPVFHGVNRARLEEGLIPSTWRELGGGIVGELHPGVSYELYLTTGLDAQRAQPTGWLAARQNGGLVDASSLMASGRVELEPVLGAIVGVAGLYNETGGLPFSAERFADATGAPVRLTLPLIAVEADARIRRGGLEARTLVTSWHYPNAGDLMAAKRTDGSPAVAVDDEKGAIPTQMLGAQLELAYDVLALLPHVGVETEQQLLPFARVEFIDLHAAVPDGFVRDPSLSTKELTVGLSYRPIPQVVLKADGQLRNRIRGNDEVQGNIGLGLMF